ncbi:hypothetical protein [Pedobacter nyackensis]|uniref:hypothetical protein n=1 Tax=Pedobacter nyackensis TaxID=475255 RepID=UPI00135641A3|nr:hypothetical protein [Pedobacter nyackensis]
MSISCTMLFPGACHELKQEWYNDTTCHHVRQAEASCNHIEVIYFGAAFLFDRR